MLAEVEGVPGSQDYAEHLVSSWEEQMVVALVLEEGWTHTLKTVSVQNTIQSDKLSGSRIKPIERYLKTAFRMAKKLDRIVYIFLGFL